MAEEETHEDIVIEFEGNFDLDTVCDKKLQFLGIETKEPVLKIDSKFYKLDIRDSIGTRMLFKQQAFACANTQHDDKEVAGKLEFYAKTDKEITAHRVMIKPK